MTEPRRTDLSYGQFGEATYNIGSQEWHFTRRSGILKPIYPVGESTVTVKPSTEIASLHSNQSAVKRAHDIKELTGAYPELIPGISLLSELGQTSESINIATSTHDPAVSQLLAFGKAADLDNQRSGGRTVLIAVIPGGVAGEAVRLVKLSHNYLGWLGHRTIALKTPTLDGGDQGWWVGNGSPIQQLCFAETEGEPSTWLAVRYSGATTILRPLLRRLPVPATFLNGPGRYRNCFPSSRIDANPILNLSIERTGGAPHADVSFNPFNDRQFALVDQRGQWSIWNIEGQQRIRHLWTATAGPNGQISAAEDDEKYVKANAAADAKQDGWGSILWAGDTNTIVVADRRTLAIVNLTVPPQRLAALNLHFDKDADWILDIKRSPLDDSHLFLVTSSRILCLHIRGSGQDEDVKDKDVKNLKIGAEALFSTRHFRDQEDISLRLQLLGDDGDLTALLYSRLATLCTAFNVQRSSSVSDPSIVSLFKTREAQINQTRTMNNMSPSFVTLLFRPVDFANRGTNEPTGPGLAYVESGTRFYKLFGLYHDLSLREGLYFTASSFPALAVRPPDTKSRIDTTKSSTKVQDDNLVIEDGLGSDDSVEYRSNLLPSINRLHYGVGNAIGTGQEDQWTVNLEWLYEELECSMTTQSASETSKSQNAMPFKECLADLQAAVSDMVLKGQRGLASLFGLTDGEELLSDVDRASSELQEFLTSIGHTIEDAAANDKNLVDDVPSQSRIVALSTTELSSALFGPSDDREQRNVVDLSNAHDQLLQSWISPLASSVPGKVRIGLEKRLRKIVAQLCLASLGVQLGPRPGSSNPVDGQDAMNLANLTLPVREKTTTSGYSERGKGKSRETSASPQPTPSGSQSRGSIHGSASLESALPTPGRTPSLHSRSSVLSQDRPENAACEHLRNLTSLTIQAPLPASMSNLLSHWAVGMDPESYDWNATRRALAAANDTEGTGDAAQVKRRQRIERRLKRQRQDTLGTSSQPQASARWDSQPEPAQGTQGSSQIAESLMVPVSQVEPGRYGSRRVTAAKATKRRKHGF